MCRASGGTEGLHFRVVHDAVCRLAAFGDRRHHVSEPRTASPPAKIFGLLVWNALSLPSGADAALFIELHVVRRQPVHTVWAEAERHHHRVGVDHVFGTRHLFRRLTAVGIRCAQLGAYHLYPGHAAGAVQLDAQRLQVKLEIYPSRAFFTSRLEPGMLASSRR